MNSDNEDTRTDALAPEPPAERGPRQGLGGLGQQLMQLARSDPAALARRIGELSVREQAELALRLPAAQRLELLLHAPQPMRLVRALPASELYLTVREVGPTDALPLLALASASQTRHLLDLETWRKDRYDADRAGAWAALMVEAGEPTMRRLLRNLDDEVLALLLAQWVRIEQLEYEDRPEKHGHGQGDAGTAEGGLTPDGYHRFSPTIPEHAQAATKLLRMLFVEQPDRYQRVLWNARWELPSQLEEQALHWRQSRLSGHGYPDLAEALEVYAPPLERVLRPEAADTMPVQDADALAASRAPLRLESQPTALILAIDDLEDEVRERVLHELIRVANSLLVADGADTGDPQEHRAALEKAAGYVEIALRERDASTPGETARILEELPVIELFRQGWAEAQALQERARRLTAMPWAAQCDPLDVLDSPVRERIAALLLVRPRYWAIGDEGGHVRDFRTRAELDETAVALEVAELFGPVVVDVFGPLPAPPETARFSTYLLTAMAWNSTRGALSVAPLPDDVVADFLRSVASRRTAGPEAPQRAFDSLVARLVEVARLDARQTAVLRAFGRYALERLSDECGALDPGIPPGPDVVSCLLLGGP